MHRYIIIEEIPQYTSAQRATEINDRLWEFVRPRSGRRNNEVSYEVFVEQKLTNGKVALWCDLDYIIPINNSHGIDKLVRLFPELTAQERVALINYIKANDEIRFGNIVPTYVTLYTKQELVDAGLIIEPDYSNN